MPRGGARKERLACRPFKQHIGRGDLRDAEEIREACGRIRCRIHRTKFRFFTQVKRKETVYFWNLREQVTVAEKRAPDAKHIIERFECRGMIKQNVHPRVNHRPRLAKARKR